MGRDAFRFCLRNAQANCPRWGGFRRERSRRAQTLRMQLEVVSIVARSGRISKLMSTSWLAEAVLIKRLVWAALGPTPCRATFNKAPYCHRLRRTRPRVFVLEGAARRGQTLEGCRRTGCGAMPIKTTGDGRRCRMAAIRCGYSPSQNVSGARDRRCSFCAQFHAFPSQHDAWVALSTMCAHWEELRGTRDPVSDPPTVYCLFGQEPHVEPASPAKKRAGVGRVVGRPWGSDAILSGSTPAGGLTRCWVIRRGKARIVHLVPWRQGVINRKDSRVLGLSEAHRHTPEIYKAWVVQRDPQIGRRSWELTRKRQQTSDLWECSKHPGESNIPGWSTFGEERRMA